MISRRALYVANLSDNVATALAEFSAGEEAPVVSSEGSTIAKIVLRADVLKFFKVAIQDLPDEAEIRKFGEVIGHGIARSYSRRPSGSNFFKIMTGTPVHLTNFIPSDALLEYWGGRWEAVASQLVKAHVKGQSRHYPYELGETSKTFGAWQEIRLHDLHVDERIKKLIFPPDKETVIGQTICRIAEDSALRLGCCTGGSYLYRGQEAMIERISQTYRFLKGHIYEIS